MTGQLQSSLSVATGSLDVRQFEVLVVSKELIAYSLLYLARYLELWLYQGRLLASIFAHLTWSVLAWSVQREQSVRMVSLRLRSWDVTLCGRQI